MAVKWEEPQIEDLKTVMSGVVVDFVNTDDRIQKSLTLTVKRVRGVVGRTNTLSDSPTEVPPEGLSHTLVLAVHAVLIGTPNFQFLIRGADGAETGFGYSVRQAEKWLTDVQRGMSVSYPVNPSSDGGPSLVRWGSDTQVDHTAS